MSDFDIWWNNEGSAIRPKDNEDSEEHAHRVARAAWFNCVFRVKGALESILHQQPCTEGGGCFYPMHDGEGNYIGEQNVDPLSVIQGMVQTAQEALATMEEKYG